MYGYDIHSFIPWLSVDYLKLFWIGIANIEPFYGYKLTSAALLMTWPIDITWTWSLDTFSEANALSLLEAIRVVVHILQYDSVSSSLRMVQDGARQPTTFTSEEWWRYKWDRMVCIVPIGNSMEHTYNNIIHDQHHPTVLVSAICTFHIDCHLVTWFAALALAPLASGMYSFSSPRARPHLPQSPPPPPGTIFSCTKNRMI